MDGRVPITMIVLGSDEPGTFKGICASGEFVHTDEAEQQ